MYICTEKFYCSIFFLLLYSMYLLYRYVYVRESTYMCAVYCVYIQYIHVYMHIYVCVCVYMRHIQHFRKLLWLC